MKMNSIFKKSVVFAIAMTLILLMAISVAPMVSAADEDVHPTYATADGEITENVETLSAMNVRLSGQITMMFYYTNITNDHSYVKITVPKQDGGEYSYTVAKNDLEKDENDRYVVKVSVAAAQQTDLVTVQWFNANGQSYRFRQYSVRYYADTVMDLAKADNDTYGKMVQPVKSMLNYGALAQIKFGYKTDNLANKGIYSADNNPINSMDAANLYDAVEKSLNSTENIKFLGTQAYLQDNVRLRVYINAPEDATATVNDIPVSIGSDEHGSYVGVYNISATKFADVFTITVTSGEEIATAEYSVLAWCLDTLGSYKVSDADKDLAKAAYLFYTWMKDYTDDSYTPGPTDCDHRRSHLEDGKAVCSDCGKSGSMVLDLTADTAELTLGEATDVTFTIGISGNVDLTDITVTLVPGSTDMTVVYKEGSAIYGDENIILQGEVDKNIVVSVADAADAIDAPCTLVTLTYTVTASKAGTYKITPVVRDAINGDDEKIADSIVSAPITVNVSGDIASCAHEKSYEIADGQHKAYCDLCCVIGEWEDHTPIWTLDEKDPQHENGVCSACKENLGKREAIANTDGLVLFNPNVIESYHSATNGDIMTENGMSFVRLHPKNTSGSEYVILHANKEKPYTNVGGYIAILYRSSLNQQLITACVSGNNTVVEGAPHWTTNPQNTGNWSFIIQEYKDHDNYDKENLATFVLYPFTVERTAEDYTDVAFVSFFDTAEDAWEFYSLYTSAYNMPTQYYFNVNANTNVDNTKFGDNVAGRNKAVIKDCSDKVLTTATSLRFGGWFTTPGGIKEYGYYVIDGNDKSAYTTLGTGTNLNPTSFASNVPAYLHFYDTYGSGANAAPSANGVKGFPIDLSAYGGKTVKVIAVAKTNFGAEIELVHFTNVKVPTQYYFNINGNTNIDGDTNTFAGGIKGKYGTNAPLTADLSGKTLTTVTSLNFGGWFATPDGVSEYGYYVIDGESTSGYNKLLTAGAGTSTSIHGLVTSAGFDWDVSCTKGSAVVATPINLAGYEDKTVTVIVVAKTIRGDEIELVHFENVTVRSAQ